MPWFAFFWSDEPNGNLEHIAEHDLEPDQIEHVVMHPDQTLRSRSSGRLSVKGYTLDGRYIFVADEMHDDITVCVTTAYEI